MDPGYELSSLIHSNKHHDDAFIADFALALDWCGGYRQNDGVKAHKLNIGLTYDLIYYFTALIRLNINKKSIIKK
tara:strand:+ start:2036 stop:2260 length:225 start_codon:yes stop_codon:yes gene_type:complete